nr:MAG TPA: hypothetical protein [Caudoviricetes sp.]DAO49829.1 MAG TPA: hypothetical protein [Caudoviricetes sp.]
MVSFCWWINCAVNINRNINQSTGLSIESICLARTRAL